MIHSRAELLSKIRGPHGERLLTHKGEATILKHIRQEDRARSLPHSTRKIDGHLYDADAAYNYKRDADKRATLLRNNYASARIIKVGGQYWVFTRRKR